MSTDWPDGYGCIELACVDSTLDEARRLVAEISGPTWIFAHEQSAARARRGRGWIQPKGNFSATLVLPDAGPPARAALRSFVAALALHDALSPVCGDALALKWPNDLLLNGGKLAGILLEGLGAGRLAIGIGVNLVAAPGADQLEAGAAKPVCLTDETGTRVMALDFMAMLAQAYAGREAQFRMLGFAPIRTAWLERAARLGRQIRVRLPHEAFSGRFEDVDEAGCLVISTGGGLRKIAAGDVFF